VKEAVVALHEVHRVPNKLGSSDQVLRSAQPVTHHATETPQRKNYIFVTDAKSDALIARLR
jgi:hypothetical protein